MHIVGVAVNLKCCCSSPITKNGVVPVMTLCLYNGYFADALGFS